LELPELLNAIDPDVLALSRTEILMFAAGEEMYPLSEIQTGLLAPVEVMRAEAITVVPSHSLAMKAAAADVSTHVTVPEANQVPEVPWATLGPSK
jgi:hypothetical protein